MPKCLFLTPFILAVAANAGIITFSGFDTGANDSNPRPNSNAAAGSFDAAAALLGTENIITFESAPLGAFTNLVVAPGVTVNGTGDDSSPQNIINTPYGTPDAVYGYNTTASGSQWVSMYGGTLTFTFGAGIQAFGAYVTGLQSTGETITFNDGSSETVTVPNPGNAGGAVFIGFTDAGKSISSVIITMTGDVVGVDDVRYVTTAAVPEPSTMLLMSAALSGLGLLRLRRKSPQAYARRYNPVP